MRTAHERINKLLEGYDSKLSASDKEKLLADVSYELSLLAVLSKRKFFTLPLMKPMECRKLII
ncbi:MAG: hypothetical protein K2X93_26120 [Candidatus Obscuribacterales bacterium]|nr:hypothetical protein [Candidatus Obscuribacterales bacterium]